jgi:FKBP-type peptidyl-prolyl cis-trans isomerase SlpA
MITIKKNKKMKKVQLGDTVTVHYTGKLENGEVFDSSMVDGRQPLTAKLGEGQLIKGFENGLLEMSIGDKKTIEISHEDAYGPYNDYMVQEVEKDKMPGDVEVGISLQADTQMGPINFIVREVKEETVVLDANHPLAGEKLIFDLELIEIQ